MKYKQEEIKLDNNGEWVSDYYYENFYSDNDLLSEDKLKLLDDYGIYFEMYSLENSDNLVDIILKQCEDNDEICLGVVNFVDGKVVLMVGLKEGELE